MNIIFLMKDDYEKGGLERDLTRLVAPLSFYQCLFISQLVSLTRLLFVLRLAI